MAKRDERRPRGRPPGIPNPNAGRPAVVVKPVRVALRIERRVHRALERRAEAAGDTVTEQIRAAAADRARGFMDEHDVSTRPK